VVVVDTPVNVKVLIKMLSQSAVDPASSSNREDLLLFCGLTATEANRRIAEEHDGLNMYSCMITVDIEGLHREMDRSNIRFERTILRPSWFTTGNRVTYLRQKRGGISDDDAFVKTLGEKSSDGFTVVDLVGEKPVMFSSIQAILTLVFRNGRGDYRRRR